MDAAGGRGAGGAARGGSLDLGHFVRQHEPQPPPPRARAQVAPHREHRDRSNPPAQRIGLFDAVRVAKDLHEHVVHHVVEILVEAEHAAHEPPHVVAVFREQKLRRAPRARPQRSEEVRVVHLVRRDAVGGAFPLAHDGLGAGRRGSRAQG
jgi:hypothetical protein